jgi:hypothetical protein
MAVTEKTCHICSSYVQAIPILPVFCCVLNTVELHLRSVNHWIMDFALVLVGLLILVWVSFSEKQHCITQQNN